LTFINIGEKIIIVARGGFTESWIKFLQPLEPELANNGNPSQQCLETTFLPKTDPILEGRYQTWRESLEAALIS